MSKGQKTGLILCAAAVLLCALCTSLLGSSATGYSRRFGEGSGLVSGTGQVAAMTTPVALPAGEYTISADYEGGGEGAYLTVHSDQDQALIQGEDIPLPAGGQTVQGSFTLTDAAGELSVQFVDGDGTVVPEKVRLTRTDGPGALREYLLLIPAAVLTVLCLWLYARRAGLTGREREYLLLVCGAVLLACGPLLLPYLLTGHDARIHLMRIEGLASSLAAGQFPVRIHAAVYGGHGLPFSIFYPELFLYIPAVLRLLGMSLTTATQLLLFWAGLTAGVSMFHAGRRFFRSAGTGCIAAVLYTLAIYRLNCVYERMALGETLAMSFLPLAVCAMYELVHGEAGRWRLLALSFTAVFQSHILSACLTVVFCGCYALLHIRQLWQKQRLASLCKAAAAALLLNLWTLVPMVQFFLLHITEKLGWTRPSFNALYPFQLLTGTALPGGQVSEAGKEMSLMPLGLGAALLCGCLLFAAAAYRRARERTERDDGFRAAFVFFLMGLGAAFMTTVYFPWQLLEGIPLLGTLTLYLQFAFRLLGYADVLLCLAAGWAIRLFAGRTAVGRRCWCWLSVCWRPSRCLRRWRPGTYTSTGGRRSPPTSARWGSTSSPARTPTFWTGAASPR